jgi:putative transposase
VSWRVARSRELVDRGFQVAVVARIMRISRQAIYRTPRPRKPPGAAKRPPADEVEHAIVAVAQENPTDGYRLVTAWASRKLGRPVNRKRVLRVMRERKLIQRRRWQPRRRRPGFFRVERPGQLWHLDMTSIWVAEHGWVYLNAIIDCCTREIVGWDLSLRCRAKEAIAVIGRAVAEQAIAPGTLTLGTDNGSAFTAKDTRLALKELGVSHRRGGYRDPESQAFIESWFRYLKERCVWRNEFETLDQARKAINSYIKRYHDRPHSRLAYKTPHEVKSTWENAQGALQKQAARTVNTSRERSISALNFEGLAIRSSPWSQAKTQTQLKTVSESLTRDKTARSIIFFARLGWLNGSRVSRTGRRTTRAPSLTTRSLCSARSRRCSRWRSRCCCSCGCGGCGGGVVLRWKAAALRFVSASRYRGRRSSR